MMHAIAFTLTVLAVTSSAAAVPLRSVAARSGPVVPANATLSTRNNNCNPMPSTVDPAMRDEIYRHVRSKTKDYLTLLTTMTCAYRESMVNNLDCGDKDSVGLFQQRDSQGWGTREQILQPDYAIDQFLKALGPCMQDHPNYGEAQAGLLAQCVQNAEAGDKYTENIPIGKKLIEQAAASVGDGSGKGSGTSSTMTASTPPAPTGGAMNVGSNPSTESGTDGGSQCTKHYSPVKGDYCSRVAKKFNISLDQFFKLNPEVNKDCQNLNIGQKYCVKSAVSTS